MSYGKKTVIIENPIVLQEGEVLLPCDSNTFLQPGDIAVSDKREVIHPNSFMVGLSIWKAFHDYHHYAYIRTKPQPRYGYHEGKPIDPGVTPDKNVAAVQAKMAARSAKGLKKYGVTTERTDLDLHAWLTHLQEELMDGAVYCERAIQDLLEEKE